MIYSRWKQWNGENGNFESHLYIHLIIEFSFFIYSSIKSIHEQRGKIAISINKEICSTFFISLYPRKKGKGREVKTRLDRAPRKNNRNFIRPNPNADPYRLRRLEKKVWRRADGGWTDGRIRIYIYMCVRGAREKKRRANESRGRGNGGPQARHQLTPINAHLL